MNADKKLGQLAFKRLKLLDVIKVGHNVESLKEQLRVIEKRMVLLGWDGKPHVVRAVNGGFALVSHPKPQKGHVIRVKPFITGSEIRTRS